MDISQQASCVHVLVGLRCYLDANESHLEKYLNKELMKEDPVNHGQQHSLGRAPRTLQEGGAGTDKQASKDSYLLSFSVL